LVRPSGTEALLRVMVEASEESVAQNVAKTIAKIIEIQQK
jgi:phosphomannomutase